MLEAIIHTVIGGGLLAIFGWAFHIHSRVAVLEADKTSLRELLEEKFRNLELRLERIEHKLDKE